MPHYIFSDLRISYRRNFINELCNRFFMRLTIAIMFPLRLNKFCSYSQTSEHQHLAGRNRAFAEGSVSFEFISQECDDSVNILVRCIAVKCKFLPKQSKMNKTFLH